MKSRPVHISLIILYAACIGIALTKMNIFAAFGFALALTEAFASQYLYSNHQGEKG